MSDRELLELAAKAAGIEIKRSRLDDPACRDMLVFGSSRNQLEKLGPWNPLADDGDALRLAVVLHMSLDLFDDGIIAGYTANGGCEQITEIDGPDPYAATRRAIVRAAAEIGKEMP